jgi:AbrB family looped-hinge helix DNA binding protein
MLAELRSRSQLTIPKEIVSDFGLKEGDKLEIFARDGLICVLPVAVYPKNYVEELEKSAADTVARYRSGEIAGYRSPADALAALHSLAEAEGEE